MTEPKVSESVEFHKECPFTKTKCKRSKCGFYKEYLGDWSYGDDYKFEKIKIVKRKEEWEKCGDKWDRKVYYDVKRFYTRVSRYIYGCCQIGKTKKVEMYDRVISNPKHPFPMFYYSYITEQYSEKQSYNEESYNWDTTKKNPFKKKLKKTKRWWEWFTTLR